jgi:hypothetical protein
MMPRIAVKKNDSAGFPGFRIALDEVADQEAEAVLIKLETRVVVIASDDKVPLAHASGFETSGRAG